MTKHRSKKTLSKVHHPPELSLSETVAHITQCKRKVAENSYQSVFTACSNVIVRTARYSTDDFVLFEVPEFLLGCPIFDRMKCTQHLVKRLTKMGGVLVDYITPYLLCICWNPKRNIHDIIVAYKKELGLYDFVQPIKHSDDPSSLKSSEKGSTEATIEATLQKFKNHAGSGMPKRNKPLSDTHMSSLKHPPMALFKAMVNTNVVFSSSS